jgi:ribosomal protein S18 acetylase RimI-like enzyme
MDIGAMVIREYQSSDYHQIIELWQLTGLGGAQRGDNQQIIEQSIAMGGKFLVACNANGKVVGTSWMTFDGRRIHLHHFGVSPSFQRMGIGKLLTRQSLVFAKEKGYQIKLEVHQSNVNAINLYKQFGFTFLGDYDVYIIRDLTAILD